MRKNNTLPIPEIDLLECYKRNLSANFWLGKETSEPESLILESTAINAESLLFNATAPVKTDLPSTTLMGTGFPSSCGTSLAKTMEPCEWITAPKSKTFLSPSFQVDIWTKWEQALFLNEYSRALLEPTFIDNWESYVLVEKVNISASPELIKHSRKCHGKNLRTMGAGLLLWLESSEAETNNE